MGNRVFMSANGIFTAADNNDSVIGGNGNQTLRIPTAVTGIQADANIERVELSGQLADYKFLAPAGTGLEILNAAGLVVATMPSLNQNVTVAFADGSATLLQTGSTAFMLGGHSVSATASAGFTTGLLGASFNTADTSFVSATQTTGNRVFMSANGIFTAADNNDSVIGGNGNQTLRIPTAVTGIQTDANIERVELSGQLADYKFLAPAGTGLEILNAAGLVVATMPSLNQNVTVAFADGSATLLQTGSTAFMLGGQSVSTTMAAALTATLNSTDKSTAAADTTPPVLASAAVNGSTLVMTYTEATMLDAVHVPANGAFAVLVGGVANAVTAVAVDAAAKTATLTLTSAVTNGAVVTVGYTDPTAGNDVSALQDAAGNDAITIAAQAVTNNTPAVTTNPGNYTLTANAPIITEPVSGTKALTYTLTLGSAPTQEVTVNYATQASGSATSGTDFAAATGTVTFAVGQTVANVSIVANSDGLAEPDETVPVLFSSASLAGNVTGAGTILANGTVGLTVVLTAGTETPVLGPNDDNINTNAPTQLTSADTVLAGTGTDVLSLTFTPDVAMTLDDAIFTNVTGVDRLVFLTTGTGTQTINTGAQFLHAFGAAGVDLDTTSTTGQMTITMSSVTGPLTLTTHSTTGSQTIATGTGIATVTATSTTGPVSITTGSSADVVTVTTADTLGPGSVISTGAGNDTITILNSSATTLGNTITGGLGADTITFTNDMSRTIVVIANADSGIALASADRIVGFLAANDTLKMGTIANNGSNYVEAVAAVADFAAAHTAADAAFALGVGVLLYSFQWDGTNGYLFKDANVSGVADQVVVLVGVTGTAIAAANIIA